MVLSSGGHEGLNNTYKSPIFRLFYKSLPYALPSKNYRYQGSIPEI